MHRLLLPIDALVTLFVLTAVWLGVSSSYDPALSYPVQLGVIVSGGVYLAVAHGLVTWRIAYVFGRLLLLASTAAAAVFILQFAYQDYVEVPAIIERIGTLTTLLPNLNLAWQHPNAEAAFMIGTIPLGVVLIVTSRRWLWRSLWIVCTLVCLYALLLTFSRGAMVGLGATLCIAGLVLSKKLIVRVGAVALLIGGIAALALTSAGSAWVLSRWDLYRNSLYVAGDYVLTGIGLGDTFPLVYSRYGLLIQVPQLTYPHNLLLSVWMGQGLPGLVIFLLLIITFYLFVRRVLRSQPRRLFHAGWLGVTAILIHGLFDSRQYIEVLWLMGHLFALIGLTAACGRLALWQPEEDVPKVFRRYFPNRLVVATAIAAVIAIILFNQELLAAWHTNQAALAETHAELNPTLRAADREAGFRQSQALYQQALAINPVWPNANRRMGNLYVKAEDFAQAVPLLEQAYRAEPANIATIKGLALAYMWNGQLEGAAEGFNLLPDPARMAEELLTWGYWRTNEQDQPLLGAYAYETSQLMLPGNVSIPVWQAAADAYRAAGELDRARQWYERILAEAPDNTAARQALAELDDA